MNMGYEVIRPNWEEIWKKGRYIALYTYHLFMLGKLNQGSFNIRESNGETSKTCRILVGETPYNIATQKRGEVINLYDALYRSRLYGQE